MTALRRWLAWAAAFAGASAAVTGRPRAAIDVEELAREVANRDDHVSAIELAAWIRSGRPDLRIVDVRSADEFAQYHIPTAEHVPLDRLAAARFRDDETIVVYSQAGVHGAHAWVFLRALGHRRVYALRRGLDEWLDDVAAAPATVKRPRVRGSTC